MLADNSYRIVHNNNGTAQECNDVLGVAVGSEFGQQQSVVRRTYVGPTCCSGVGSKSRSEIDEEAKRCFMTSLVAAIHAIAYILRRNIKAQRTSHFLPFIHILAN